MRLSDEQIAEAERGVEAGRTVAAVARELGVPYGALYQRLRRKGSIELSQQDEVYRHVLVFWACCSDCGKRIEAVQEGENGTGFPTWVRLAKQHAHDSHGVEANILECWVGALWGARGRRDQQQQGEC